MSGVKGKVNLIASASGVLISFLAFSGDRKQALPLNASKYQLLIYRVPQSASWDHTAVALKDREEIVYKSLCQKSHFAPPVSTDNDTAELDDYSRVFIHLYENLFRPIFVGEAASFERESMPFAQIACSIPISRREYELVQQFFSEAEKAIEEGRLRYAALDKTRGALEGGDSQHSYRNCASFVEGALACLDREEVASTTPLREAFCTWPSGTIERAHDIASKRAAGTSGFC